MGWDVFICEECHKVLKPHCNTKMENGKTYCVDCHWELFGRERMKQGFKKVFDEQKTSREDD